MPRKYIRPLLLSILFVFLTTLPPGSACPEQAPVALPPAPGAAVPEASHPSPPQPVEAEVEQAGTASVRETPAPSPSARRRYVLGYYTVDYPGDKASSRSLKKYGSLIDSIASFSFQVDGDGNLTGSYPGEEVQLARGTGVDALALIHNYYHGGFSADVAHRLLASSSGRRRLVDNTLRVLKQYGYRGVNIDLENVPPADRDGYSALVREMQAALQPHGYITVVSIPARTHDDPDNPWSGGFDYGAIGRYADRVQVMTYDEHYAGGPPGPIASLPWVERVVRYAVQLIPRDKILLGIAAYGYDWSATGTSMVPAAKIPELIRTYNARPLWSNTYSVPYFYYYKDGVRHEVWYEDAASLRLKLDLVQKYDLMGIGIWRLGHEDGAFWQAVAASLR